MTETIENIKLGLINEPSYAMRSEMDDEKLRELAQSIKLFGLMQPIAVRKVGKGYEIIAGHRRYMACKLLEKSTIPCIVKDWDDKETDMGRMHENLFREDINPVDEADYLHQMVTVHKMTMDDLVRATGKRPEYIQARLDLMQYPQYLLEAIHAEQITLGAASWLVRIKDDNVRAEYTRFAIAQGITASRAKQWFMTWEMGALPREAASYVPPPTDPNSKPQPVLMPCVICREEDELHHMEMHFVHGHCVAKIEQIARTMERPREEVSEGLAHPQG